VTGLNGWNEGGRPGLADGGIQRLRYTGKPSRMITNCRVGAGVLHLEFNTPLDQASAEDVDSYSIEQWNYRWTAGYGSRNYHPETGEVGTQFAPVTAAKLSPDGRSVALTVPYLQPVHQLHLRIKTAAADGRPFEEEIYWTIHNLPEQ
ncbi:MAG: hypothetical protein AAF907_07490, partial [Planctomycetota bacterium]